MQKVEKRVRRHSVALLVYSTAENWALMTVDNSAVDWVVRLDATKAANLVSRKAASKAA